MTKQAKGNILVNKRLTDCFNMAQKWSNDKNDDACQESIVIDLKEGICQPCLSN